MTEEYADEIKKKALVQEITVADTFEVEIA